MSARIVFALGLACACSLAGCSTSSQSSGVLDYESTGGLAGTGDGTELHVDATRRAERVTRTGGAQTATLDAATFAQLRDRIDAAGFAQLAPQYGCGGCTDDFVHVLSVEVSGRTYGVQADATADVPPALDQLITTIRAIVQDPSLWH